LKKILDKKPVRVKCEKKRETVPVCDVLSNRVADNFPAFQINHVFANIGRDVGNALEIF